MCFEFVLANMYSMLNAGHRLYYVTAKAREVVLQNVASHLKGHESPQGISNNKKGQKRGCPKSEKKELVKELFKKLKKENIDHENSDIYRHEFQKKKLEDFRKGEFTASKCALIVFMAGTMPSVFVLTFKVLILWHF